MCSEDRASPSVTVGIPVYNEQGIIETTLSGFLNSGYPRIVEIIVADGGSTDGTREIVERLAKSDPRIRVIHNPLKIQAAALNLIIDQAQGEVIIRADAHSEYAPDYVEQCVKALVETKALNVGGAQRFAARTPFQSGVAIASKSFLGSGGAKYRNPGYNGPGDTVYLGCSWKKTLLDLKERNKGSVYDISQVTNEDAELNAKLLEMEPDAVYISSGIKVWYFPRTSVGSLWSQYFRYGRGRYLTKEKHSTIEFRSKLPFYFLLVLTLYLIGAACYCCVTSDFKPLLLYAVLFLVPLCESLRVTIVYTRSFKEEIWRGGSKVPSFFHRWFYCLLSMFTISIAHFFGFLYQIFRRKIMRIEGW